MSRRKEGLGVVGLGAAACAACCVGPILGFLAAIGLGTALGVAAFGLAGLAIAALAVPVVVRRSGACEPGTYEVGTLFGVTPAWHQGRPARHQMRSSCPPAR